MDCYFSLSDNSHHQKTTQNKGLTLYTILQVLSLTLFEKIPLEQSLGNKYYMTHNCDNAILQKLFDFLTGHWCTKVITQLT